MLKNGSVLGEISTIPAMLLVTPSSDVDKLCVSISTIYFHLNVLYVTLPSNKIKIKKRKNSVMKHL